MNEQILTGADALRSFITKNEIGHVIVKRIDELEVGDYVEGQGVVIRVEPGKAPVVKTSKGEIALDKKPPDYPVSVSGKVQ